MAHIPAPPGSRTAELLGPRHRPQRPERLVARRLHALPRASVAPGDLDERERRAFAETEVDADHPRLPRREPGDSRFDRGPELALFGHPLRARLAALKHRLDV